MYLLGWDCTPLYKKLKPRASFDGRGVLEKEE
jgi:hypothetical protein